MQSNKSRASALLFASLLAAVPALADDQSRGRLPDGRAFRTDDQGNQLVDYIAELEMNIETLNRQVHSLEGELDQKEAQLKVQFADRRNGLTERDITTQSNRPTSVRDLPIREASQQVAVNNEAPDCSRETKALQANLLQAHTDHSKLQVQYDQDMLTYRNAVQRLEDDLHAARQENARGAVLASERAGSNLSELNASMARLEEERDQLIRVRDSHEGEIQSLKSKLAEMEQARTEKVSLREEGEGRSSEDFERCEQALADSKERLEGLERELTRRREEVSELRSEQESYGSRPVRSEESSEESSPRAGVRQASLESAAADPAMAGEGLGNARVRAVQVVRGQLNSEINKVNALVMTRDRLFSDYRRFPGRPQLAPSRIVSSRGESLGLIMSKLRAASTVGEISQLAGSVGEIRATVEGDISRVKKGVR
jgi:hypothetical protein